MPAISPLVSPSGKVRLAPLNFTEINGFAADDHLAAFEVFAQHARAIIEDRPQLRPARAATDALKATCRAALAQPAVTRSAARRFFEAHFQPFRITTTGPGFVTGYYEPIVAGSLKRSGEFAAPILARPDDLVTLPHGTTLSGRPELSAARVLPDGTLVPYPDRAEIEASTRAGQHKALVWLADPVEVFLIQVQGSARVRLPDGRQIRLTYAGRNGHPYTSIGRILVESGEIAAEDMSLTTLKAWIRAHGRNPGDVGAAHMLRNKSYVFFALAEDLNDAQGPIGGAGLSLPPLRSIAVDRGIWSHGLPLWLAGDVPWERDAPTAFRQLMITADTGSAIVGGRPRRYFLRQR
jgi:membrane-bound lytic murein transglycosylase A